MTADYSMALEHQAELARRFADGASRVQGFFQPNMDKGDQADLQRIMRNSKLSMSPEDFAAACSGIDWDESFKNTLHALQFGATYACMPQISAWLETAARSIPDSFALERSDPPALEGFIWTAAPCTLPETMCVHAYSWHAETDHLDIAAFGHQPTIKPLTMLFIMPWPFGVSIADGLYGSGLGFDASINQRVIADNPDFARLSERLTRFWSATFVFLQQRVFSTTNYAVNRPTRKRLARTGATQVPVVRVVHLRRQIDSTEASAAETYGDTVHEWHWQWLVRGHWRKQYFPTQQRNRPVFIQSYVKGPKDKPLKPVTTTVYSVDR